MLKYGPYPVLTIREIPQGRLFQDSSCSKVHHMVSGSQEWESMSNQDHHGLQVVVNDLFPLLALEEAAEVYHHFGIDGAEAVAICAVQQLAAAGNICHEFFGHVCFSA